MSAVTCLTISVCFFTSFSFSIHSFPRRQPASEPQSPRRLSCVLVLFCHQLDDPHLHSLVNRETESKNQWMEGSPEQWNAPRSPAPHPLSSSFGGIWYLATLGGHEGAEAPSPPVTSSRLKDCPFPLAVIPLSCMCVGHTVRCLLKG